MKQIVLAVALTLVFGLVALAQDTAPSSSQTGTQPSATSPSPSQQTPDTATGSQSSASSTKGESTAAKGEKKLRGCIESQGGQYVLKERHGKEVTLTGSADFASHVGHTVTVHGTYEAASASSAGSTSGSEKLPSSSGSTTASPTAGASGAAGEQFMVSKIDHESDTCKMEKGSKSKGATGMSGTTNPSTTPSPTPSTPPQQ